MARRALARGEFGEVKLSGWVNGGWVKEETVKAEKLKTSKWRATVLFQDGKAKRPRPITAEATAKESARAKLTARMESEKRQAVSPELGKRTVEEAVNGYLERLESGKVRHKRSGEPVSPETVRTYRQVIKTYVLADDSTVKDMRLADVTAYDLMVEAERLRDADKGAHLNHVKAVWTAVFSPAALAGAIPANPVKSMEPVAVPKPAPRKAKNGAIRDTEYVLSYAETDALIKAVYADREAVRKGIADLILLGVYQGLRIREAVSLRWEDLDMGAEVPTLSVRGLLHTVSGKPRGEGIVWEEGAKSDASVRTIPLMGAPVIDMLRRRREERAAVPKHHNPRVQAIRETYVFLSPKGFMPSVDNIKGDVRLALDGAGFPNITYHNLRHTLSVRMKAAGVAPIRNGWFFGHTEQVSMAHYSQKGGDAMPVLGVAEKLALPRVV